MSLASVFEPIEAVNRAIVMANTWGHLAPEPNRKHEITIVFCHGEYRDVTPIKVESLTVCDSPWFFEDMNDFIYENRAEPGNVYKFRGWYKKFKNGNYRFSGKIEVVSI